MLRLLAPPSFVWCVISSAWFVTPSFCRFVHPPQFWSPSRSHIVIGFSSSLACQLTLRVSINSSSFRPCTNSNRPAFCVSTVYPFVFIRKIGSPAGIPLNANAVLTTHVFVTGPFEWGRSRGSTLCLFFVLFCRCFLSTDGVVILDTSLRIPVQSDGVLA